MPYYDYNCISCDNIFSEFQKIDNRFVPTEKACSSCGGQLKLSIGTPARVDETVTGRLKPPRDFVDMMNKLHKNTPGSQIKDRWG